MSSASEDKEYERDSFEDAPEVTDQMPGGLPHSSSTRSLTDHPPSTGSTPVSTEAPPLPSPAVEVGKSEPVESHEQLDEDADSDQLTDLAETPRRTKLQKSPLLTAHRLSTTSMDEVNLAGNREDEELESTDGVSKSSVPPSFPSRDSASTQSSSHSPGFLGSLPSIPFPTSPVNKDLPPTPPQPPQQQPAPAARRLPGPFAWLTRSSTASSNGKVSHVSALNNRRNTAASVSTTASLSELDADRRPRRNSLKDQFKMLRMREEGSVLENDQASVTSGRASISQSAGSPPSIPEESEDGLSPVPATSTLPSAGMTSTINPNLAPGTVSGVSASASDATAPVDWELWQQVVNTGPEALSGANSEEIKAAFKRGIPQTIRGVIWQVLADSRNPDLEEVYRELVARGTDRERERQRSTNGVQTNGNGADKEKESLASSRSSIRSDTSQFASSPNNGTSQSPSQELDGDKLIKEQALLENTRKQKAKEEAAALQKLEKTIRRDLGARTSYSRYFISQGNQEALFGLCKAYALYDEQVGYAQGMNFIVMPLLFNMDEAEAFTLLVKLMNKYTLREMFIPEMPGLHRALYQFERLLEDLEPALYCHLRRRGVPPQLYATQWFLTLFAYRFPLQLVLRIYDLIFEEGLESTILKFALAIMRRNAETLLGMDDMSSLTTFLKERLFDVYIDKQPTPSSILESGFFGSSGAADKEIYRADIMVQDACAIPLTHEMIKTYTSEWEDKVRTEKEHELELEGLRYTVAMQSTKIRVLEERAEASDKEHVQLASELVRLKVENEELQDTNEALRIQVNELKVVVDRQPVEVEEKLRTEMDRIMQRNLEVQNENRAMEEQMADMEKELVDAKMKWAEISEDHEALKQKWQDLRKALD